MDPDFVREIGVLGVFIALYVFGSAYLLRGHKADLSAVAVAGTRRAAVRSSAGEARLNRRRKARLREAAARGELVEATDDAG